MSIFRDHDEKVETYRAVFDSDLGRKVLEDMLSNLFWLPGADKMWSSLSQDNDVETLRNFAVFLLGCGGLEVINSTSNEEVVRKLLEVSYQRKEGSNG